MTFLVAAILWAQVLQPMAAYTTADPVTPDRLGLATPYGRYAIVLSSGCPIESLQRVYAWPIGPDADAAVQFILAPIDAAGSAVLTGLCTAHVDAKMSDAPCFGDGVCDVRYELPE